MIVHALSTFFQVPKLSSLIEVALRSIPTGVIFLALIQLSSQLKRKPALFIGCLLLQMKVTNDSYMTAKMLSKWFKMPISVVLKSEERAWRTLRYSVHITKFRHALWISKWNVFISYSILPYEMKEWLRSVALFCATSQPQTSCDIQLVSKPKLADPYDPQAFICH